LAPSSCDSSPNLSTALITGEALSYIKIKCMKSKVSVRGQTVVPREIRKALGIHPQQLLNWELRDGAAVVRPMPDDPVRASIGILKGFGSTDELLEDRRRDLELEEELDHRW